MAVARLLQGLFVSGLHLAFKALVSTDHSAVATVSSCYCSRSPSVHAF